jgi:biopolymer transport protein TolQ
MNVNINFIIASNPFFDAYTHSDFLGKIIFISLILLSVLSWVILIYKIWQTYQARKQATRFYEIFQLQRQNPLGLETDLPATNSQSNPFFEIYAVLKKQTLEILNKNRRFSYSCTLPNHPSFLSPSDIDYVGAHLATNVAQQTKNLEKNLFILATVVSLAPFLGLLGTVWGILTTFSEMQTQVAGSTHQMVLGGLSLALATTVLGLLDAIPALIGYNYLKNSIKDFEIDMDGFSTEILALVEMQYRKVDLS